MTWPRWMRWVWNLRWNPYLRMNGSEHVVARIEAKLQQTRAETPFIRHAAKRMASLPVDEFAERVVRAFGKTTS